MGRIIVCDTGPLLHLSEAGAVHLLGKAGDVFVPPCVVAEFETNAQGWKMPVWVQVRDLHDTTRMRATDWTRTENIDAGEAEAISLALQLDASWFLTDDARARRFAEILGLEVHGSIGLLLWNTVVGNVEDEAQALKLLDDLALSSLWVSERVLSDARNAIHLLYANP
ncbi:MAG: hypothetical protein FJZ96_12905 [Chloroflexi bacterium]|nr:hypothetical protein [Chloroflexota bacterium]